MQLDVPYKIGDEIEVDGQTFTIKGIHIYITLNSDVIKWRFHIGNGKFVTVENKNLQGESNEHKQKKTHPGIN